MEAPRDDYGSRSVFRPGLFAGKAALVTGGGTGLGLAITRELLGLGCDVTIVSRSAVKLERAVGELRADRACVGRVHYATANIKQEAEVAAAVASALRQFGRLDYLVNNGGGQFIASASEISANGFRAVLETNLLGTFVVCREAYTQCMQAHGGAIVNITMVRRETRPPRAARPPPRGG
jgi:peroxisomal trans-2-enoyl-CoA reductase